MPAAWRVHVLREGLREAGIDAEVVERDLMALEGAQRQAVLDVMIGQDLDPPMVLVDDAVVCAGEIDVAAVVAAAKAAAG
ncbi:MAG: hypothetical protein K0B85_05920 [Coriobacteriia bacterium]|nr:hypothetical protein [Coriobacteriia bacterium]